MTFLFVLLIILVSVVLGFFVLVQNPKGGGLAGSFAGISNQFMGVKQTTDVLEKGTWISATVIALLCLTSTFFISRGSGSASSTTNSATEAPVPQNSTAPGNSNAVPLNPAPAPQK